MKTAFMASVLAGIGTAQAHPVLIVVRYACPASQELTVMRDSQKAHVSLAGRTYDLERRRSSIGAKYLSSEAALIIDGPSAVFVGPDNLDLGTCTRAVPVASVR